MARLQTILALAVLVLTLSGCARYAENKPVNVLSWNDVAPPRGENDGLVILGVSAEGDDITHYGLLPSRGKTVVTEEGKAWGWRILCSFTDAETCRGPDGVRYHIYRLPPGEYVVAWTTGGARSYFMIDTGKVAHAVTQYMPSRSIGHHEFTIRDGRVTADTPRFSVGANEVVYVGNIKFTTSTPVPQSSFSENKEAARQALARFGETREMAYRPWTRDSGPGPRPMRHLIPSR